jgi:hypothetical protein
MSPPELFIEANAASIDRSGLSASQSVALTRRPLERPTSARVYDALLGGSANFEADRRLANLMLSIEPEVAYWADANRRFLHRAVRTGLAAGVRQILDIGCGILTEHHSPHVVAAQVATGCESHTSTMIRWWQWLDRAVGSRPSLGGGGSEALVFDATSFAFLGTTSSALVRQGTTSAAGKIPS